MSIEVVRRIYEAFARGDLDAVMAECAADVVVGQDPALPWGGRYVGRDGIAEFALKLVGTIESEVDTEQLFQAGDQVVQQGRTKGTVRHNGAAFDLPECHVWTLRDDVVLNADFYIDSQAMLSDRTMSIPTTATVTIEIDAPPAFVYDLVTDVTRMGEWSPECVRCEWLGEPGQVGSTFRGRNRSGLARWSTDAQVLVADRPARVHLRHAISREGRHAVELHVRRRRHDDDRQRDPSSP